jgi:hypothetical protein
MSDQQFKNFRFGDIKFPDRVTVNRIKSDHSLPTIAVPGASAGSAHVTPAITGSDVCGIITVTFGNDTFDNTNNYSTVTFNKTYEKTPYVFAQPCYTTTTDFGFPFIDTSTTGFNIYFPQSTLVNGDVFKFMYFVIESK